MIDNDSYTAFTYSRLQRAIRPLCNLSLDDALELMDLVERHVDWEAVRQELEEFSAINGQGRELR